MARNITRKRIDGTHVNAQAGPSNIASSALSETGELKTSEQMGERREALLAEKQAELEQVLDKHDDNVRILCSTYITFLSANSFTPPRFANSSILTISSLYCTTIQRYCSLSFMRLWNVLKLKCFR